MALGGASAVAIVALAVWAGSSVRQASRPPARYLVPDAYVGWVRVEYGVPGAPPVPLQDGRFVLTIPPDARLRTSSPEHFGWAKDEFFYYRDGTLHPLAQTPRGGGGAIWGRINGEATTVSGKRQYEEFFVGSEQQFQHAVNPK